MISDREYRALEREVRDLRQGLAQRPLRGGGGAPTPVRRIVIRSGNTLATGQLGVKYSATPITDVPSAYDPNSAGTLIDGVGRGELFSDGVSQGYVLVLNDGGGGTAINFDLLGGSDPDVCSPVAAIATLTVAGDPLTTVNA